jgi:ABC-type Fe3+-hydroxamate transport system substrate-binding protein
VSSATPSTGTSTTRKVLAVVITILGLAAVVVALLLLTSNNNNSTSSNNANAASNAPQHAKKSTAKTVAFSPATVNVAVLNGTATAGLAHRVSVMLAGDGFKQGAVATAADQTRTATVVGYMPGKRAQGIAVAHALKLGPAVVQSVDPSTRAVACPPPAPCPSAVIVTVGSDLQNTP